MRKPKYALHKASGQARITVNGKRILLGKYNSPESLALYEQHCTELEAQHAGKSDITISGLALLFMTYAKKRYDKSTESENFRLALRHLCDEFPTLKVRHFGPKKLQQARAKMVESGLRRSVINARVRRIRQFIKWGVANEHCTPGILTSLKCVEALKAGETSAPEAKNVAGVKMERVEPVLPFLTKPVRTMVLFMLHTGCRPGEAVHAEWKEIDQSSETWIYEPSSHKTAHFGKSRQIAIGPQAQSVLNLIREFSRSDYVFDPQVGLQEVALRRYGDETKCRTVGEHYSRESVGTAIRTACEKAFDCPADITTGATVKARKGETTAAFQKRRQRAIEWRAANVWSPNQLRKRKAEELRKHVDLETAQSVLGHSSKSTTERYYARLDISRAVEAAVAFG